MSERVFRMAILPTQKIHLTGISEQKYHLYEFKYLHGTCDVTKVKQCIN